MQRRHMMHSTASAALDSPRQSGVAHGCFCNPHRQEPDIPSLLQTISKAASPLSFLETKRSAGPLRVMLGTAHSAIVVPTHHRQMCRSAADAHPRGDRTKHPVRKTPLHVPDMGAHIRQGLSHMFDAPTATEEVTCSPLSRTTWYPTCHHHSQNALGALLSLPLFSWALRQQKVSR